MKILLVTLTILTYTYLLIKNFVTRGRSLMVLSGFLHSSSLGSTRTVFPSQVRATDNVFPTAYRAEQCLAISVSLVARPVTALGFASS